MRSLCVTPGIVLRSWAYGESDKIVSFLTAAHGKVTGIAKGAQRSRKRFVNTLEPFSLVKLYFQDRPQSSLAFLHACDLIRSFKGLTTSLERMAPAFYLLEIMDGLVNEREDNPALFEHLKEGLTFLEVDGGSLSFLTSFELKLLDLAGYRPAIERCCRCRRDFTFAMESMWRFSVTDGGVLCGSCPAFGKDSIPLSPKALCALVELQKIDNFKSIPPSFPVSILKEARSVLLHFIQVQSHRELKSVPFLESISFG
ncbi:MAG: DNA repair protein RecO [Deltaproteobacteria bacterium]|nr:DNA repair protein RecO [Deltaproteobacteria bacterium]